MHNLSAVHFIKHLYMFQAYLQSIIRRYTIWIQQLVLNVLFRCLSVVSIRLYLLMMGCRYTRNMQRCLMKYTEHKLASSWFFFKWPTYNLYHPRRAKIAVLAFTVLPWSANVAADNWSHFYFKMPMPCTCTGQHFPFPLWGVIDNGPGAFHSADKDQIKENNYTCILWWFEG